MPQSPAFSITGGPVFADNSVSFAVDFADANEQGLVLAYEWYLDGLLLIDAIAGSFSAKIACGNHTIGVRLLTNAKWTGIQEQVFYTCKTVALKAISGPSNVIVDQNVLYSIVWTFTDGSSVDMSSLYSFSSSKGGAFSGNIFTAIGDSSLTPPFGVTITATSGEETPLTKDITVIEEDVNSMGILVVDLYNNSTLNVIGLIDNAEVAESHEAAYTGNNFIPVESSAANALILASDFINQEVLNWRFEFNLHKLKLQYPATDQFKIFIKGRGATVNTLNAAYEVFNLEGTMIMANSPGTYLPSISGGTQVVEQTLFTANIVNGANGSYDEDDLTLIVKLIYIVSDNSITYTTN